MDETTVAVMKLISISLLLLLQMWYRACESAFNTSLSSLYITFLPLFLALLISMETHNVREFPISLSWDSQASVACKLIQFYQKPVLT